MNFDTMSKSSVSTDGAVAGTATTGGAARLLNTIDHWLDTAIEWAVSFLVVAEVVIFLTGVVARYVFVAPLVWSDELASLLFIWLTMLGAVIAFRRGEHMRMTFLVKKASPATQALLDTFAAAAALLFLLFVFMPSVEHAWSERLVTSPGLGMREVWWASAIPFGFALMILSGLAGLARHATRTTFLASLAILGALVGTLIVCSPLIPELGMANLLLFLVVITAVGVFSGVPIGFAFGLGTLGYISFATSLPTTVILNRMAEGMTQIILLAVPLFVFLGHLMQETGMAKAMVEFLVALLGRVRGGLSYVLIGAMYLVSGISGAKAADMAAVAPIFPGDEAAWRQTGRPGGAVVGHRCADGNHPAEPGG